MSTTITSVTDVKWEVTKPYTAKDDSEVAINSRNDGGNRIFKTADVLNAMRAEGVLDAVEIITELPKVEVSASDRVVRSGGEAYLTDDKWADGSEHRRVALQRLAVARYCEAKHAKKVAEEELEAIKLRSAEALLKTRRHEVALKLGAHPNYTTLTEFAQRSIDLVIALEDQLAAK